MPVSADYMVDATGMIAAMAAGRFKASQTVSSLLLLLEDFRCRALTATSVNVTLHYLLTGSACTSWREYNSFSTMKVHICLGSLEALFTGWDRLQECALINLNYSFPGFCDSSYSWQSSVSLVQTWNHLLLNSDQVKHRHWYH